MPEDVKTHEPADPTHVDINDEEEVDYRCEEWGCSEEELKAAVMIVGNVSADVLAYLRQTGRKRRASLSLDNDR